MHLNVHVAKAGSGSGFDGTKRKQTGRTVMCPRALVHGRFVSNKDEECAKFFFLNPQVIKLTEL